MKLKSELPFIREKFALIPNLPEYAKELKAKGNYRSFETRLAWDCLRATISSEIICDWYKKYDCNDDHITTAAKAVLKERGIL